MAWIKATHDLPDKAEVVAMATKLGIDQDAVVGKLLRVWIWFDRETTDGRYNGVTPSVTDRIAFCPGFGRAMADVGWIIYHDDGTAELPHFDDHHSETAKERALTAKRVQRFRKERYNGVTPSVTPSVTPGVTNTVTSETETESEDQITKVRTDTTSITPPAGGSSDLGKIRDDELEHAAPLAGALFKKAGYSGKDGGLFWQVAVLVKRGAVVESLAFSACEGARLNAVRNPVGFVRRALSETCQKQGKNLPEMLRQAVLPQGFDRGPPQASPLSHVADLANALSRTEDA